VRERGRRGVRRRGKYQGERRGGKMKYFEVVRRENFHLKFRIDFYGTKSTRMKKL
jgi:hypothetical protein